MNRKRSGWTLYEILTVLALMSILFLLIQLLIFPVLRSVSKNSGKSALHRHIYHFLRDLDNHFVLAAPQGVNFEKSDPDWSLALVLRVPPTPQGAASWSKDLMLYHYDSTRKQLWQGVVGSGNWPTGAPTLGGGEPGPLSSGMFLPRATIQGSLNDVTVATWPTLDQPLHIKVKPDGLSELSFTRTFGSHLTTP
ncbi:hypothetical protein IV102_05760 [bacterium]|nr:hypothetical protein [bacterium]